MTDRTATRLDDLRRVAVAAHAGQVDRKGAPYAEHIEAVAASVPDEAKPVAFFHDAVEDRRMTRRALARILTANEMTAVDLLTRGDCGYAAYIARIAGVPGTAGDLARLVKVADLRHNLGRLTPELESLRPRYEAALRSLGSPCRELPCSG